MAAFISSSGHPELLQLVRAASRGFNDIGIVWACRKDG